MACHHVPDDQTQIYCCKQELEKTTSFISRAALIVKSANAKKKKKWISTRKLWGPVETLRQTADFVLFTR